MRGLKFVLVAMVLCRDCYHGNGDEESLMLESPHQETGG